MVAPVIGRLTKMTGVEREERVPQAFRPLVAVSVTETSLVERGLNAMEREPNKHC